MTDPVTPVAPKTAKASAPISAPAAPLTAAQTITAFTAGGVISVVEDVAPGVQTKTVTINGETITMTISTGTNKV